MYTKEIGKSPVQAYATLRHSCTQLLLAFRAPCHIMQRSNISAKLHPQCCLRFTNVPVTISTIFFACDEDLMQFTAFYFVPASHSLQR